MQRNLPVPPGPVAPFSLRWVWSIGPAAALTAAYRLIPAGVRSLHGGGSSSHTAMRAILAGGGWQAFRIGLASESWPPKYDKILPK